MNQSNKMSRSNRKYLNQDQISIFKLPNCETPSYPSSVWSKQIIYQKSFNSYESGKSKTIILKKRKLVDKVSQNDPIQSITSLNDIDFSQIEDSENMENMGSCRKILKKTLSVRNPNSQILRDLKQLQQFFQFQVNFKILYRASDYNFSVQKFHQLCDEYTNTIVLCRTKQNQIIGGYTPLSWKDNYQKTKTYFKSDRSNQTFLFSLTKGQKYPLQIVNKNRAICCFKSFGPTFGGGYDLQVGNYSDRCANSISYFPRNFKCRSKKANYKHLTGSRTNEFKIIEWEVFKVIKIHSQKVVQKQQIQFNIPQKEKEQQSFMQFIKNRIINPFS